MDTSVLKNFAAETRRELAQGVAARLDAVLMRGSNERLDFPVLVGKLEQAIAESSREAVIERVTYLWFNRLVAMRFMDARGYSPVGVVSPEEGVNPMQAPPQVVSDAFAGMINESIVKSFGVAGKIRDIVNGVARSQDPYSDVFALLVDEYAQYFQTWVPAMFPEADDVSNLLLPANLLAAHSVVRKIAQTMTVEMCQDVEVIGWLYQFYIAERKDEVFDGFKKGKKAGAAEIPAATQLFTPNWIVRYLVQNTVGRTWLLNNPDSALREQMEYFVEPVGGLESVQDFVRISSPEELTVLDPAVGSGHMLTYAFDLLYEMYCEAGYAEADIPGLILAKNLVGVELDERAGALAAFALTMKARERFRRFLRPTHVVAPQICVLQKVSFTGEELRSLGEGFDFAADHAVDGGLIQVDADVFAGFWNQFESADVFGSLIRPDAAVLQVVREHVEAFVGEMDADSGLLLDEMAELREKVRLVLRQAELLTGPYVALVANPPYMGTSNMGDKLSDFAKSDYPETKSDLCTMFVERGLELVRAQGTVGMVTMQSWMFLKSFVGFRQGLLENSPVSSMFHIGTRGFDSIGGEVVGTTAFVLTAEGDSSGVAHFVRLADVRGEAAKAQLAREILAGEAGTMYRQTSSDFLKVPDQALVYWLTHEVLDALSSSPLSKYGDSKAGISTGGNGQSLRLWSEVSSDLVDSGKKWYLHNKGGEFRKWYGNIQYILNYSPDHIKEMTLRPGFRHDGKDYFFKKHIGWSKVTTKGNTFRYYPEGMTFDSGGLGFFPSSSMDLFSALAYLNSNTFSVINSSINSTMNTSPGNLGKLPYKDISSLSPIAQQLVELHKADWDSSENSWDFTVNALCQLATSTGTGTLAALIAQDFEQALATVATVQDLEHKVNLKVAEAYSITHGVDHTTPADRVTLLKNPYARYGTGLERDELLAKYSQDSVKDLISYFVGVLFGRYSLDTPGLILANQGEPLGDYLAKVGTDAPTFIPDEDNVIPVLADDRFDDDIVAKFRAFLKKAFGEENLEANLTYIEATLGKSVRKYFTDDFYKDHLKRYSKRPIYWMFSSTGNSKGSFKALVYMHRYTPATVSTVLNDYLRPYMDKLTANREHLQYTIAHGQGREATLAQKEDDVLAKTLKELTDYQDSVLYPLAVENIHIDLDNGVAHNYPLFGGALHSL